MSNRSKCYFCDARIYLPCGSVSLKYVNFDVQVANCCAGCYKKVKDALVTLKKR